MGQTIYDSRSRQSEESEDLILICGDLNVDAFTTKDNEDGFNTPFLRDLKKQILEK